MKITSGEYKYRKLEIPDGIRPTTEKVREAIFSMIASWIPDAVVLDLFAGSGALGLEALSRGAGIAYFNELDRKNYKILNSNINHCRAEEKSHVMNGDFRTCLEKLGFKNVKLDVILMDPPYHEGYYEEAFDLINEMGLLDEGSIVVAEHLYDNKLSESYGRLRKIREKKYGTIGVDLFIAE